MLIALAALALVLLLVAYVNHLYEGATHFLFKKTPRNLAIKAAVSKLRYSPTLYLPTSWLKMYSWMGDRFKKLDYRREVFPFPDGGKIGLDFYPANFDELNCPILVILPGLNGNQHDSYVVYAARKALEMLGCRSVVYNKRGFAGVPLTGKFVLSWPRVEDFLLVVKHLRKTYPAAPLLTMGFSMGANFTELFLGETAKAKEDLGITASVAVSSPHNPSLGSHKIDKSLLVRESLVNSCVKEILKNEHTDTMQALFREIGMDARRLKKVKKIRELDETFTCRALGLPSADDYYNAIAGIRRVEFVNSPLLCISSENDPLIDHSGLEKDKVESNEHVFQVVVKNGGHIEYCHGWRNDNWAVLLGLEYFKHILDTPAK